MLQIASGKLFARPAARQNELRGVLYSNLRILRDAPIETAAGRLLSTNSLLAPYGELVYEFTELMEETEDSAVLISHGMEPYIHDFAAVASLALNATCTVSPDDTRRLTSDSRGTKVGSPPRSFIPRVFDEELFLQEEEIDTFVEFVRDLIGLKRRAFLAAMRAIRTYVVALHRLADDLELSYTLLVASIESLAQSFDRFDVTWDDYNEDKRKKIDSALAHADKATANRVRATLLDIEKVAISRRFREFAKAHLQRTFFRDEATGVSNPLTRAEADEALGKAYGLRSSYIHELRELPRALAVSGMLGETVRVDGVAQFTFRGLARVARHVIIDFVRRQPKVKKEIYSYESERHGVVTIALDPRYWIGRAEGLKLSAGTKRLEGFLTQLSSYLENHEDAKVTDLRPMLKKVEGLLNSGTEESRRAFLAVYFLFNALSAPEQRMVGLKRIEESFGPEFDRPSVESLLVHMICQANPDWPVADYDRIVDGYFGKRRSRRGLRLPRTFEAGILLEVAERYRVEGDLAQARDRVSRAVECYPGHEPLLEMEQRFDPVAPINWFSIVFPHAPNRS